MVVVVCVTVVIDVSLEVGVNNKEMENESDEEVSFNPQRYTAPITYVTWLYRSRTHLALRPMHCDILSRFRSWLIVCFVVVKAMYVFEAH